MRWMIGSGTEYATANQARLKDMDRTCFANANHLLGIPKLPNELFNLICKPEPKAKVEQVEQSYDKNRVVQFCECITVKQLDFVIGPTGNGPKEHWSAAGPMGRVEQEEQ